MAKDDQIRLKTPQGEMNYVNINRPHKKDGIYCFTLVISPDKAQPLVDQMREFAEDIYPTKAINDTSQSNRFLWGYKIDEETGNYMFKFSSGKKKPPVVLDVKGTPINLDKVKVARGSIAIVKFTAAPKTSDRNGLHFWLNSVTIGKLVEWGSNSDVGEDLSDEFDLDEDDLFQADDDDIGSTEDTKEDQKGVDFKKLAEEEDDDFENDDDIPF